MTEPEKTYHRRRSQTWLSVNDAAEVLGCAPKTVYRLIAAGTLPCRRVNGTRMLRIAAADVDRLLAEVPAPGP